MREKLGRERERDGEQKEGWQKVERRHKRSFTTFFFTRFPDGFDAEAMWGVFNHYGKVKEVVIPTKRLKTGQRFGFVRFWDVKDPTYLERRLDNIIIGCTKLNVNLPRFNKDDDRQRTKYDDNGQRKVLPPLLGSTKDRRSFKETLLGKKGETFNRAGAAIADNLAGHASTQQVEEQKVEVDDDAPPWLLNSLVGKVKNVEMMNAIHDHLILEGITCIRARYLGDNLVLLTGENGANVTEIWNHEEDWLDGIFESISPWSPEVVLDHRLVWLRCEGIPLHLWKVSFFKEITKEIGEVIAVDGDTRDFLKVDAARLCVRTAKMESISVHLQVNLKEVTYPIRILEELPSLVSYCNGCRDSNESQSDESEAQRWFHHEDESPPSSPGSVGGDRNSKVQILERFAEQVGLPEPQNSIDDPLLSSNGDGSKVGAKENIDERSIEENRIEDIGSGRDRIDEVPIMRNLEYDAVESNMTFHSINSDVGGVGGAKIANLNNSFQVGLVDMAWPTPLPTTADAGPEQFMGLNPTLLDEPNPNPILELDRYFGNQHSGENDFVEVQSGSIIVENSHVAVSSSSMAFNSEGLAVVSRRNVARFSPRIIPTHSGQSLSSSSLRTNFMRSVSREGSSQPLSRCNPVEDSEVANCNGVFWLRHKEREARKLWELGQDIGVCYEGNHDEIIKKLEAMEERDVVGISSNGGLRSGGVLNQVNP